MRDYLATIFAGIFAIVVIAVIAILLLGCGEGKRLPGLGPTVTTSHPELREPFLWAAEIAGASLREDMLADPALVIDVVLIDGPSFTNGEQGDDGVQLWGKNRLVLTNRGPRCEDTLALRTALPDVHPSGTSLSHEAAHCALDWLLRPDPHHEMVSVWGAGGAVEHANQKLLEAGL